MASHPNNPQDGGLSDAEIATRKQLLTIKEEDGKRLRDLASRVPMKQIVVDAFTKDLAQFPEPAAMFQRLAHEGRLESVVGRVAQAFEQILGGVIDRNYVEQRRQIGRVHARIGLEPKWYIGALNLVQQRVSELLRSESKAAKDPVWDAVASLWKMVFFDIITVLDSYSEHTMRQILLQEQALRELSAPVIEVWDEVLVLPLIGTMDTRRSQEVTEALLNTVVEKRAKVVIIDITGLPVMDTSTANHLFKTVRAVELLGTVAIVTGVRPAIAQTVVSLGIDTAQLRTKARLVDGLRLALQMTGRAVVDARVEAAAARPKAAAPTEAEG